MKLHTHSFNKSNVKHPRTFILFLLILLFQGEWSPGNLDFGREVSVVWQKIVSPRVELEFFQTIRYLVEFINQLNPII